jgi:ketosteroid isomerase-like protein
MAEESVSPDLVERTRRGQEAANRGDLDGAMTLFAPDAVYVTERFGQFKGRSAIRGYFEDWYGSFDDLVVEMEEVRDLGNGVIFAPQVVTGRHASSSVEVTLRNATVHVFVDGLVVSSETYVDIAQARAAAERLAHERAQSDV